MARFKEGDYAFLGIGGPRVRIERVWNDDPDEGKAVYFVVGYDRGECGLVLGEQLRPDRTGLPSQKVADTKMKTLVSRVEALKKALKPLAKLSSPTDFERQQKIRGMMSELGEQIARIDRDWSPKYHQYGLQPFNNLEPVQKLAYTPTKLRRKPNGTYRMVTASAETFPNPKHEGMEFVILAENPQVVLVGTVGHSPMAEGKQVLFAGHVFFDIAGNLLKWNNNTGHYKSVQQYAHQATIPTEPDGRPVLPLSLYQDASL